MDKGSVRGKKTYEYAAPLAASALNVKLYCCVCVFFFFHPRRGNPQRAPSDDGSVRFILTVPNLHSEYTTL